MAFQFSVGFATEPDLHEFETRIAPKVRGHRVDPLAIDGTEGFHRMGLAVTSQSAAKEVCHLIMGFLAHAKNSRVTVHWLSADGQTQAADINAGQQRDAELLAMRLGAAAKAAMNAEKSA